MFINLSIDQAREPVLINIEQICSINGPVIKMTNGDILTLQQESLRDLLVRIVPKEREVKDNAPKKELLELFERLHKLTGGKGKTILTLAREKKLKDLLTKHRMTEQDLIQAATNIGNDAFLQGDNDSKKRYGDVDYLLRPDKAAKWAEDQQQKKKGMF